MSNILICCAKKIVLCLFVFNIFLIPFATGVELISNIIQIYLIVSILFSVLFSAYLIKQKSYKKYILKGKMYFLLVLGIGVVSTVKYVYSLAVQQGITFFTVYQIVILAYTGFMMYVYLYKYKYMIVSIKIYTLIVTIIILIFQNRFMLDLGVYRMIAIYENPNILGLYAVVACVFLLYLMFTDRKMQILYWMQFSISMAAIVLSLSRGALFAVIVGVVIFYSLSIKYHLIEVKYLTKLTTILFFMSLLCIFALIPSEKNKQNAIIVDVDKTFHYKKEMVCYNDDLQGDNMNYQISKKNFFEFGDFDNLIKRFSFGENGDSSLLNNLRLRIWKEYISDFQKFFFWGDDYAMSNRPKIENEQRDPHNTLLYIFYRYGIFITIIYIIFLVDLTKSFVKREKTVGLVLAFSIFLSILVISCINDLLNTPIFYMVLSIVSVLMKSNCFMDDSCEKKLKVLHVFSVLNKGGAESRTMDIYRNIDLSKISFDFAVTSGNIQEQYFYNEILSLGGRVFEIQSWRKIGIYGYFLQWKEIFRDGQYDIVHAHSSINSWFPLIFAYFSRIPKRIAHARDSQVVCVSRRDRIEVLLKRLIIKLVSTDRIYCSKESAIAVFGENSINENNVWYLPNAIDINKFGINSDIEKQSIKQNMNLLDFDYIVGTVGNSRPVKNHIFLVKVFRRLLLKYPNSCLVIVGNDDYDIEAKEYIRNNGIENNVIFTGVRSDVKDILSILDLFVLPSISEGAPGSVIEAQATNIPCILSDTITRSVDANAGLVKYLSLEEKLDVWIDEMIDSIMQKKPPISETRQKLCDNNFHVSQSVDKLMCIYFHK